MRFELDPTSDWTDELIAELVETGAVDSVDFKGFYEGTVVDQPTDPDLYRRVIEASRTRGSRAPAINEETRPVLGRTRTGSPGTRRSTPSPTSRRCRSRPGWST